MRGSYPEAADLNLLTVPMFGEDMEKERLLEVPQQVDKTQKSAGNTFNCPHKC